MGGPAEMAEGREEDMRIIVCGADFEENLGLGMIAAAAEGAGHDVRVVPFNERSQAAELARQIAQEAPDVVGLSVQFQHRAFEFLGLARLLRAEGYRHHITCGGQFPTLAWREVLEAGHGIDSIVLHEGERGFVDLLGALESGRRVGEVPGIAFMSDDGAPVRTPGRMLGDLDELPFPKRYRPHAQHMGIPFIPIMGGRGCWGRCRFCSITSFYRDARAHAGGKTLRHRSPENIAQEIALLAHAAGGTGIFCFHDDNFLLPRTRASAARVGQIREHLDLYGVGKVAMIGKCRPDTLDEELARELAAHGMIRMYVGVENASEAGTLHLRRGTQTDAVRTALRACREAGIFSCYNLLLFEPDATLDDVRTNVAFMRAHASHPVNFCRAEPYFATPLQLDMAAEGRLGGSYLGYDYRIADDRTELLFRVCSAAFRERNFSCHGVANRYMGLGYSAKILAHFYDDPHGRASELGRRAEQLTRAITEDTAGFIEEAIGVVDRGLSPDRVARETALLGLRISASDHRLHLLIDELSCDMQRFANGAYRPPMPDPTERLRKLAQSLALGTSLAVWATGCGSSHGPTMSDPLPRDAMVVDDAPADTGVRDGRVVPPDSTVVDWVPFDAGLMDADVDAMLPEDATVVDDAPADAGVLDSTVIVPPDSTVVDWVPFDAGVADPAPADNGMAAANRAPDSACLALIDQWRDTTALRAVRSTDLPLSAPPNVELSAERDGDHVRVVVRGGPHEMSYRWHGGGEIDGDGREVRWKPESMDDHIRVAVRSAAGVAVVSMRARNVEGGLPFDDEVAG